MEERPVVARKSVGAKGWDKVITSNMSNIWGDWYAHNFYYGDIFTNDYLFKNIKTYTFNICNICRLIIPK